jgi:uncharacterized damage-inducible protein DinB
VFRALTDASLKQGVAQDHRTLGRLAWHITISVGEMMGRTGLKIVGPAEDAPVPGSAAEIVGAYEASARSLLEQVEGSWSDETLAIEDDMYGQRWKRSFTVSALISHQTHHRGQMTVLMRQAGLEVPGVYGPARQEWAGMGMPPPSI